MIVKLNLWDFVDASERPRSTKRYGWSPKPSFDIVQLAMAPSKIKEVLFQTPRPVDLLRTLRRVSNSSFTARDQTLLEIMLSVIYEDGRFQEHNLRWKRMAGLGEGQHAVPLAIVRHILGGGSRVPMRDLEQSIARVAAVRMSLPAPYEPRRRASAKRAAEDRIRAILNLAIVAPETGSTFAPSPFSREAEEDLSMRANDEVVRREILRQRGIATKGRTLVSSIPITVRPPRLGPTLAAIALAHPGAAAGEVPLFAKLGVASEFLVFETTLRLRDVLRSERLVRGRRLPFVHLDLATLAAFRSPYTVGLFRATLAESYDTRLGRRAWNRTWTWAVPTDDLASMVGYARQAGGWRAQVLRNVVRPALADLARSRDPLHVELVEDAETRPDAPFTFRLHLPLPNDVSGIAPVYGYEPRLIADLLLPSDYPLWTPGIQAMLKAQAIAKIDDLANLTRAWRIAVDEVHNAGGPYYSNVTGNADRRRYRGARLREAVETEGVQRAAALFALEEADDPDLIRHEILDRLAAEGTWKHIDDDQRLRWSASRYGLHPGKVDRQLVTDGVEAECARLAQARADIAAELAAKNSIERRALIAGSKRRYAEFERLARLAMQDDATVAAEAAAAKEEEQAWLRDEKYLDTNAARLGLTMPEDDNDDVFERLYRDMVASGQIKDVVAES